jgi:hypothetical protein
MGTAMPDRRRGPLQVRGATFEGESSKSPAATQARGSSAMCGEFHNRTGSGMLKLVRPAHDQAFEAADQPQSKD